MIDCPGLGRGKGVVLPVVCRSARNNPAYPHQAFRLLVLGWHEFVSTATSVCDSSHTLARHAYFDATGFALPQSKQMRTMIAGHVIWLQHSQC